MSLTQQSSALAVALAAAIGIPLASAQSVPPVRVLELTREIACAAHAGFVPPVITVRVAGGQDRGKMLFGTGDALVLSGGTAQGLKIGQEYFVRRIVPDRFTALLSGGIQPLSIKTAGWIRVVDVQAEAAIAIISSACDGVLEGDYLEPFTAAPVPPAQLATGEPDYANPGHVVLGDERRQLGGPGSLMVIDRGSDHGVHAGQRVTIFRETRGGSAPVFRVGEAWVVRVNSETSLIRIETSRDAVYVTDGVAFHR